MSSNSYLVKLTSFWCYLLNRGRNRLLKCCTWKYLKHEIQCNISWEEIKSYMFLYALFNPEIWEYNYVYLKFSVSIYGFENETFQNI